MNIKDLRVRIGLLSIRRMITSGNCLKACKKGASLSKKYPDDESVLTILADANLFVRAIPAAKEHYKRTLSPLDVNTSPPNDSKRFLRAYISYRLLEADFLQDNQKGVAKSHVVETINAIPAGASLKALFFIDAHYPRIPRPYGSRNAARRSS